MDYSYTYSGPATPELLTSSAFDAGFGAVFGATMVFVLIIGVLALVALILTVIGKYKTLKNAGHQRPWAALIPFYSDFEMSSLTTLPAPAFGAAMAIVGLASVAFANIDDLVSLGGIAGFAYFILNCVMSVYVGMRFEKSVGFRIGMCVPLVSAIFWFMLPGSVTGAEPKKIEDASCDTKTDNDESVVESDNASGPKNFA